MTGFSTVTTRSTIRSGPGTSTIFSTIRTLSLSGPGFLSVLISRSMFEFLLTLFRLLSRLLFLLFLSPSPGSNPYSMRLCFMIISSKNFSVLSAILLLLGVSCSLRCRASSSSSSSLLRASIAAAAASFSASTRASSRMRCLSLSASSFTFLRSSSA